MTNTDAIAANLIIAAYAPDIDARPTNCDDALALIDDALNSDNYTLIAIIDFYALTPELIDHLALALIATSQLAPLDTPPSI